MKAFAFLLPVLALASCASPGIAPPAPQGSVDHIVLLWLKRPGNAADQKALAAATDELRAIPGSRFLDHGTALPSDRPIVDDSFDFALVSRFESVAALRAYETNPLHLKKLAETIRPLAKRTLVYDVVR